MSRQDDRSLPAFGAVVLLVLAAAMMYGLTLLFAALHAYFHEQPLGQSTGYVQQSLPLLTIVQLVSMGTALVVGLRLFDPEVPFVEALSLRPIRAATLASCLGAGFCLQFPLAELANALHAYVLGPEPLEVQLVRQQMLEARTLGQGLMVIFAVVAAAPLVEELLFRGLFLFGLERRYGRGFALLLSSTLFGVVHLGAVPALYATVAGLLLGTLALTTRSIFPGLAVHAAINALPVLLPESVLPIRGFNVPSELPTHLPHALVWPPLLLGLGLLAVAQRIEYAKEA